MICTKAELREGGLRRRTLSGEDFSVHRKEVGMASINPQTRQEPLALANYHEVD
jgi:hypothetical protein